MKKDVDKALNVEVRKFIEKFKEMEDHVQSMEKKIKGLEHGVLELSEENDA